MAEDKRNRDQEQGGNQGQDRDRRKDRKPGSGNMETPGSGRNPQQDEDQPQE
jgi:hypothetical protein